MVLRDQMQATANLNFLASLNASCPPPPPVISSFYSNYLIIMSTFSFVFVLPVTDTGQWCWWREWYLVFYCV